ncbi:MAG TPA: hypothetical protein VK095_16955, partial [Beutenbergiaceae bacterium]|nr:hypothetical protein [Beutenbergiaceae bacterium]
MTISEPRALFSMTEGYAPLRNLLGAGDPNVHWIDDRWWMFFGGFQATFRNNIFAATLAPGEPLHEDMRWRICTDPNNPRRAQPLVAQPASGHWDRYGLHEPSFAEGHDGGAAGSAGDAGAADLLPGAGTRAPVSRPSGAAGSGAQVPGTPAPRRRIYYAGRASRQVVGNTAPYSIGMLELTPAGWRRHPRPVLTGTAEYPSALGPKVIYAEGKWRMWFRATPGEAGKGERPLAEIHYTESEDGISNWSTPRPLHSHHDGFAHAFVLQTPEGFEMLLSKSPNLYGEQHYPEQKLWLSTAKRPSGDPADWSEPRPVLAADGGAAWYRSGFFGSSLCAPDPGAGPFDERFVFFTGVHTPVNWPRAAVRRLASRRLPPVPAPYYFTIASARLTLP